MAGMRWLLAVASVCLVLLSGCMQDKDPGADTQSTASGCTASANATANATCSATTTTTAGAGNATAGPAGNGTAGNATGNATVGNSTGNATDNATAGPVVIVFQDSFSGSLPVDGLEGAHTFDVPAGAVRVEVTYTSDHVGLFTALATVSDPSGERISSSDACGFGSTGAETDVCLMVVDTEVGPGAWTAAVFWQLGQATEDYTLDVVVYGVAA